jgi:thiamine biosynthesis lipoprotein
VDDWGRRRWRCADRSAHGSQRRKLRGRSPPERRSLCRASRPSRGRPGPGDTPGSFRDHPGGPCAGFTRTLGRALLHQHRAPSQIAGRRVRPTSAPGTSTTSRLPLHPVAPVLTTASFSAMGTSAVVAVEDPTALALADGAARAVIEAIDATCSRFREDSELSHLNHRAGSGYVEVSELLDEAISIALDAAAVTSGLVDPTIGALIERVGYTVTFAELPLDGPAVDLEIRSAPGWETVLHDRRGRRVALPDGASLDLGAAGKAWAADRAAQAAAKRIGTAALVACGGDVALAGPDRLDGWRVRVAETIDAAAWQDVLVFDGGLATSGMGSRTWRRGGQTLHHILDPSTGLPAASEWVTASVAATTCADANAAATAAIVLGDAAPSWLGAQGLPARLVHRDGSVVIIGSWPEPTRAIP